MHIIQKVCGAEEDIAIFYIEHAFSLRKLSEYEKIPVDVLTSINTVKKKGSLFVTFRKFELRFI